MANIVSMELTSIEFTFSFYTISKYIGNNSFTIRRTINNVEYSMPIIIPDGNYGSLDLLTYLNNYVLNYRDENDNQYFQGINFFFDLNEKSNSGSARIVISSFPITEEELPLVYPIESPLPSPQPPEIATTGYDFVVDYTEDYNGNCDSTVNLKRKFGWILGFRHPVYGKTQPSNYYVSEGILDTTVFNYIYLVVNDYNNNVNNSFYGAFENSLYKENVLARLSILSSFFSTDMQNNVSNIVSQPREYFGPVMLQRLHIQLLDEYGNVIDTNNMDFSFTLSLNMVYDM
jgi:hypothetical protein